MKKPIIITLAIIGIIAGYILLKPTDKVKESAQVKKVAPAPVMLTEKSVVEKNDAISPPEEMGDAISYHSSPETIRERIANLNHNNIREMLAEVEALGHTKETEPLLIAFMRAWATMDGHAAADYALNKNGQRKFRTASVDDLVIGAWARYDANAAINYLKTVRADHNRDSMHKP